MKTAKVLSANNSSGKQELHLTEDEPGEFGFTLVGVHNEKKIQIDFDTLDREQLNDMMTMIDMMLISSL